ncbi:MAG TPA: dihydroneopterin aldolase [Spirochaetota bacterium]|mgnify:CR=1 FL=1|nr:dihydroneopterin aldolase [Spirochaetota bacterium]HOL58229.1 dihydroneopterin aldolase [Spirochaetota bacterium]HPP04431.1 dihydroneopterin aldolase [Spirochaetota bacterium]
MKIYINNLKVNTIIGVYNFERKKRQKIFIDLEIEFNLSSEFNDSINQTVDYDLVLKEVKKFVENSNFYTLEKLCIEIINLILKDETVKKVKCKIRKDKKFKDCKTIYIEEIKER